MYLPNLFMVASLEALERRIKELERDTEDLQTEVRVLREREGDLLAILSNTPAPIYLKDAAFKYIRVNRRYEALAHVTSDALSGLTDYDIFPKAVADLFRQQDEEVIRAGRPREFEETIPLPDGEFTFITVKFPVFDEGGKLRAVGGFCADITARKKTEKEREELLERLRASMKEVATLRKILPICACCRQIRDEQGGWSELETYLLSNAELEFSHSVCPDCARKLYGEERWFVERKP
jgi:PAS domain S-box-containing protein